MLKSDLLERSLQYFLSPLAVATHLITGKTTHCYKRVNYARAFRCRIHVSSRVYFEIKTFSMVILSTQCYWNDALTMFFSRCY